VSTEEPPHNEPSIRAAPTFEEVPQVAAFPHARIARVVRAHGALDESGLPRGPPAAEQTGTIHGQLALAVPLSSSTSVHRMSYTQPHSRSVADPRWSLTAMGWKFADMLREGRFTSAEQAAGWVERNVGGSAACGTAAPAPATAATVAAAPENK